ncbi:putative cellulase [Bipolaris maydis]|nr:glycoside hydrolase family 5 protein [Bipolaris maydis]KAJ5060563.1 putative cellulase [Bipolaris maydis]KAJ6201611.1 putative cellulase [Bipolaris maydis]KAJ6284962.1 glycoside hydrolase [Bipolaris maydis]
MAIQTSNPPLQPLRTSGNAIVNAAGQRVVLKGTALGGYLNMENFITGYSGHEHEHRAALTSVLGKEKAQFFFDRLLHHFFTEADAEFFASLGMNCIRIPFNYRHFIDDQNPTHFKKKGFELLDRAVNICAKYHLYVVLDLHAVPGGQNQDWHCDSGLNKALFWDFRVFQDQAIELWKAIAAHYNGNPVVCGYNLLNEPADPQHVRLISWYERAEKEIRAIDPETMLFIDGNTYAMDFTYFQNVLPNSVYACHDYAMFGFPIPGQPLYNGSEEHKTKLKRQFDRKVFFMREKNVPIWNGEFGPVYANEHTDPEATEINSARYHMLQDQLKIYAQDQVSWSIWLYKDIGYQGMTYVSPDTPYMKLIAPFVTKKQKLALDFWGIVDKDGVKDVYEPFIAGLKKMIPEHLQKKMYPNTWTFDRQVERAVREGLMSEYLGWEFAELFKGKTEEDLEELAKSFAFENCIKRDGLNMILQEDGRKTLAP